MKKILALMMTAIFVFTLLTACKKGKEPEATEQPKTTDTLWNKSVSYTKIELPDAALEDETFVARAISPDGSRVFISSPVGQAPYLWDLDREKKIPLTVGNDVTADALRMLFWNAAIATIRDSEELEEYREKNAAVDTLKGDKLLDMIFSTGVAPTLVASGATVPVKNNVITVTDAGGTASFVLDADSGALYAAPSGICIGAVDGTMYCLSKPNVIKYESATGKELEKLDFSFAMSNGLVSGAFVLADGTVCAVLYGISDDVQTGVDCVLAAIRADGKEEIYPLGKRTMSQIPAKLCAADGRYFVLQNSVSNDCATFVDTETGEIALLVPKGSALEKVPLGSRLDDGGAVNALTDDGKVYRFYTGMGDGETILCSDRDGEPALFRPSTAEVKKILPGVVMPVFTSYSGNGYDRWLFFDPIDYKNVWIRFDVK